MTTETIETFTNTEIVPKLEFDSPLDVAVSDNENLVAKLKPLQQELAQLKAKVSEQGINRETYEQVGSVLTRTRSIGKNEVAPLWSRFEGVVQRAKDYIREKRQKADNLCAAIDAECVALMKRFEKQEDEATAKEQKKHPEGTVKQNVPSVGGYRRSTVYRARAEDRSKFLNAFLRARGAQAKFLGQFLVIDEQALSKYYRENHDKESLEKIPGVKYSKE